MELWFQILNTDTLTHSLLVGLAEKNTLRQTMRDLPHECASELLYVLKEQKDVPGRLPWKHYTHQRGEEGGRFQWLHMDSLQYCQKNGFGWVNEGEERKRFLKKTSEQDKGVILSLWLLYFRIKFFGLSNSSNFIIYDWPFWYMWLKCKTLELNRVKALFHRQTGAVPKPYCYGTELLARFDSQVYLSPLSAAQFSPHNLCPVVPEPQPWSRTSGNLFGHILLSFI